MEGEILLLDCEDLRTLHVGEDPLARKNPPFTLADVLACAGGDREVVTGDGEHFFLYEENYFGG